jgi:hypothetical protein
MSDSRRLTIRWASTACYRDSITFYFIFYTCHFFHYQFMNIFSVENIFEDPPSWDSNVDLYIIIRKLMDSVHLQTVYHTYDDKWVYLLRTSVPDFSCRIRIVQPITVAALSKAWTVFARSNTGIVGSNPTRGIDVCVWVYSAFVLSCL